MFTGKKQYVRKMIAAGSLKLIQQDLACQQKSNIFHLHPACKVASVKKQPHNAAGIHTINTYYPHTSVSEKSNDVLCVFLNNCYSGHETVDQSISDNSLSHLIKRNSNATCHLAEENPFLN